MMYAVADVVPENCDYLTAGKRYEVVSFLDYENLPRFGRGFLIFDDKKEMLACNERKCLHLSGGNWRLIDDEV